MPNERILVVDDEHAIVDASTTVLSRQGYSVKGVNSAEEAIDLAIKEPFDLLLTDIMMPGMNGIELLRTVKHIYPDIVGVMITGHGTIETAIESMRSGAQSFVLKPFTASELRVAIEEALARSRLLKENVRLNALMPLFEVSRSYHTEMNLDRLLRVVAETIAKAVRADQVTVLMPESDRKKGGAVFRTVAAFPDELKQSAVSAEIVDWVTKTAEPFLLSEDAKGGSPLLLPAGVNRIGSALYVPLQSKGKILGVLGVRKNGEGQQFSDSDMEMISIQCGQAAVAIENALLLRDLESSYVSLLATLANALEARDAAVQGHCQRMSQHAMAIARQMGLHDGEVEAIRLGGVLHDIGKIGIPDNILRKTGRLTNEEYDIVKRHPIIGAQIIAPVERLSIASPIIRHHHERYDGSGYPDGLKGEDIPLGARIVAVSDAFEAMTEDRPYHNGVSMVEALEELQRWRGVQFDPKAVDAFFEVLHHTRKPG